MRSEAEVRDRLRALVTQELDHRVAEAQKRRPHLCRHNYRHPLDDRKTVDGEPNEYYNRITVDAWVPTSHTLGLCLYGQEDPENWRGDICEDDLDAQRCPLFEPIKTKEVLWAEFSEQLHTPGWIDEHLPAVAELLWVLEEITAPALPWWKRIWYHWILRLRIEPVKRTPSVTSLLDPSRLLEGHDEGVGT